MHAHSHKTQKSRKKKSKKAGQTADKELRKMLFLCNGKPVKMRVKKNAIST